MKAIAFALLAGGGVLALMLWIRQRRSRVSAAWLVDHERRSWGVGLDQVGWRWPYVGYRENPKWNAERDRKRA